MITEEQAGLYRVRDDDPFGADEERPIADYADAFATSLERIARQIRRGDVVSDLGPWVSLIGRMMERKI